MVRRDDEGDAPGCRGVLVQVASIRPARHEFRLRLASICPVDRRIFTEGCRRQQPLTTLTHESSEIRL